MAGVSDAVAALKEHFGERIAGTQEEGRDLMVQALQDDLGLSHEEAAESVDALARAHSIEWIEAGVQGPSVAQSTIPFAEALGAENPAGAATSAEAPIGGGYWRL
ncbi:MAG: hypothetical protein ACRDIB_18355 [Ardenticatenaceae bacterium]